MDESFRAILKYLRLAYYPPSLGIIVVLILGCILLFVAVMLNLRTQRSEKRKPINPCWIGSMFLEYCFKRGWVIKEGSEGKNIKWYPTERGRQALKDEFEISISIYDS